MIDTALWHPFQQLGEMVVEYLWEDNVHFHHMDDLRKTGLVSEIYIYEVVGKTYRWEKDDMFFFPEVEIILDLVINLQVTEEVMSELVMVVHECLSQGLWVDAYQPLDVQCGHGLCGQIHFKRFLDILQMDIAKCGCL